LTNPGFEDGPPGSADDWAAYGSGYTVDESGGHSGSRALQLVNDVSSDTHGAQQVITLNQTEPWPLYFSGWSKAQAVSGDIDSNYSIYLDVYYTDGSPLWGQTLRFDTGAHDWQFREGFIVPAKPIETVYVYCLLRNTHSGVAWFDDLSVQQVQSEIATFDSVQVATSAPSPTPYGGPNLSLATGAGLSLTLAAQGGALTGVTLGGTAVQDSERAYASGFFVRDVANETDFIHVGGSLAQVGETITHTGLITALDLDFSATYTATADRIVIHAEVADTSYTERAVTLYFALPITAAGWTWGDDIRTSRIISGVDEFDNFRYYTGLGATGYLSKYPWASLSGPPGGIALGVPLDSLRIARLIHNPATNQFYAAFDLGLSTQTTKFPRRASVDLVLYHFDPAWGFRAAARQYYDRFPMAFARRIPPEQEGIWVAFSDLSPIPNVEDFGIAFHELGSLGQVDFDDSAGILSFRYIAEPWSHWLRINDSGVDVHNYDQVIAYLQAQYQEGSTRAQATLSSGFFDENDHYLYDAYEADETPPWCDGLAGCAAFILNPDPDISDATYPLNKANLEWNQAARDTYTTTPGLDGEYVDSFLSHVSVMDFRTAHFAATDTPLTYRTGDWRVGIPETFATTEFVRWLAQDVHDDLGRWLIANGMLLDLPWGADLFDFMGRETDWLRSGSFVPQSDARLSYYRTLSFQRPYGLLMNTQFENLSHELVEQYFQVCLFYGIYPSMFSHNASSDRYWDDPALYERDRPLFQRYIPLIRRLNVAGWEPVTYATTSDPDDVYIERFGDWPNLHFTLRNTTDDPITVDISVQADDLELPAISLVASALLGETLYPLNGSGSTRTMSVTLAPQASEILCLMSGSFVYLPLVLNVP
jgi:hypothetical protein